MINRSIKSLIISSMLFLNIFCIFFIASTNETKAFKFFKEAQKNTETTTETHKAPQDKTTSGEKQLNKILTNGKPSVLYFTSEYCRDCQEVKPIIEKLKEEYEKDINFLIVDIKATDELSQEAIKRFRILGVPFTVFVKKDGVKKKNMPGSFTEDAYKTQALLLLED